MIFGVKINYVHEEAPLERLGALGLLGKVDGPLLVINGDILTHVDFRAMVEYHQKHKACLTVGVRRYDLQVPYGVVECSGTRVCKVSEKPQMPFLVNAGIYLIEPTALQFIPRGLNFDMPDLIQRLISEDLMVVSFPILEYWGSTSEDQATTKLHKKTFEWGESLSHENSSNRRGGIRRLNLGASIAR